MSNSVKEAAEANIVELQALREELSGPELDQGHLFKDWPEDPNKLQEWHIEMLQQLSALRHSYPGGVQQYIRTGKRLLLTNTDEAPYVKLELPKLLYTAPSLFSQSDELEVLERQGTEMLSHAVFVLVAGGLGERLGYTGIKVSLPVETATRASYLQHYLAFAHKVGGPKAPFIMMTSDDTHARTKRHLEEIGYGGMDNVRLLKQETVFCFRDKSAHLSVHSTGKELPKLLRKPHGHGDVHALLASARDERTNTRLIDTWLEEGYKHIIFFQDTNAIALHTMPVSVALSDDKDLAMNFTCIPRKPREAVGLLCHTLQRDSQWKTCNVEYNVFAAGEGGDEAAPGSDFSPYPGSINTLVLDFPVYHELLVRSHGVVPEFINPKYADEAKTIFKKPARVESLMQDVALLFDENVESQRVGGTVFERFTYQPVKNALDEAADKAPLGIAPYCAATGEADYYEFVRRRLQAIGVPLTYNYEAPEIEVRPGIEVHVFPVVTLPLSVHTLAELHAIFPDPTQVSISANSTLVVVGKVVIKSLQLEGALRVEGPAESSTEPPLVIEDGSIRNDGWSLRPAAKEDHEIDRIRGFVLRKTITDVISATKGRFTESEGGQSKI